MQAGLGRSALIPSKLRKLQNWLLRDLNQ
jgi:hypothetical protein